jgi:hypothetical protein
MGMTPEENEVLAATLRFYEALADLSDGRGLASMDAACEHGPRVTCGHPIGEWSYGWDEVRATWAEIAALGRPGNAGTVRNMKVHLYGDVAYTTGVFVAAKQLGGAELNITNILNKRDGVWRIVHHHADKMLGLEAALAKMAEER